MQRPETQRYLSEIARTLAPGGRVFATFFLIDPEAQSAIANGRVDFSFAHRGNGTRVQLAENPDHAVAHPRDLILQTFADLGLNSQSVLTCGWRSGKGESYQDVIIARR